MSKRTIGVMGRLLDQDDGLGVYGLQLLRELLRLDPFTRYLILLDSPKSQHLFREFGNAATRPQQTLLGPGRGAARGAPT
jgi:hypothetical protein